MSATPIATPEERTEAAEAAVEAITELGQPGGGLLAGADPGPEGHSRVGPRLRRRRDAPRRARVGREGADAVADHRGGRQDRAVRVRGAGAVLRRPDRPDAADRQRGAVLGRRGHRHVDHGHRAGRGRDLRAGLRRADRRVDPPLLRHARRHQGGRVLRFGAQRRLGRLERAHPRQVRRGEQRVGAQRPEGVGHQRRHLRRARGDRHRRPRARLERPRGVRRADERGQGHLAGHEGLQARSARLAHRRCVPRRLSHSRRLRARRQGEARRAHRPRARGQEKQVAGRDADVRGLPPDGRLPGAGDRSRGLRVLAGVRQGARAVRQARSSRTSRSRSRWHG